LKSTQLPPDIDGVFRTLKERLPKSQRETLLTIHYILCFVSNRFPDLIHGIPTNSSEKSSSDVVGESDSIPSLVPPIPSYRMVRDENKRVVASSSSTTGSLPAKEVKEEEFSFHNFNLWDAIDIQKAEKEEELLFLKNQVQESHYTIEKFKKMLHKALYERHVLIKQHKEMIRRNEELQIILLRVKHLVRQQ
jgi:hypothetical protein